MKSGKIEIILSAIDKMSGAVSNAVSKSTAYLDTMQKKAAYNARAYQEMALSAGLAGGAIVAGIREPIKAFSEFEKASANLKSVLMEDGGAIANEFAAINLLAEEMGNKLPGSTTDFQNMFTVLLRQGLDAQSILEGVGKSAAYLAVNLDLPYDEAAKMAARLKVATGVANAEFIDFIDVINRANKIGVDPLEMKFAFARSAGALKLMSLQGLEASKAITAVYSILLKTGASGETVGTGMSALFNAFFDAEKMQKFNEEASKFGMHFDFIDDKTGQFKGIEDMMSQLNQLNRLTPEQSATVIRAMAGTGQDAQLMATLVAAGQEGYNTRIREMAQIAHITRQIDEKLKTLPAQFEALGGAFNNLLRVIGSAIGDDLKGLVELLQSAAIRLQEFANKHPQIVRWVLLFVGGMGALLVAVGAVSLAIAAFSAVAAAASVSFFLWAAAAIAVVALIYIHWGSIKEWFSGIWSSITESALSAFNSVKEGAASTYNGVVTYVSDLSTDFYNAGKNIIKSIVNGIKDTAIEAYNAIANVTSKMRDYLPFSPAKEGAFRDIHRIKIVETIADNIKPAPVVNAMRRVAIAGMVAASPIVSAEPTANATGGFSSVSAIGGVTINYSPTIQMTGGGGGSSEPLIAVLRKHKDELARLVEEAIDRRSRSRF